MPPEPPNPHEPKPGELIIEHDEERQRKWDDDERRRIEADERTRKEDERLRHDHHVVPGASGETLGVAKRGYEITDGYSSGYSSGGYGEASTPTTDETDGEIIIRMRSKK